MAHVLNNVNPLTKKPRLCKRGFKGFFVVPLLPRFCEVNKNHDEKTFFICHLSKHNIILGLNRQGLVVQ